LFFITFFWNCNSMCPFANSIQNYNFSGDWIIDPSYSGSLYNNNPIKLDDNESLHLTKKLLLKICHPKGSEIFFGIYELNELNKLIGYGSGNWSSYHMGVRGQYALLSSYSNNLLSTSNDINNISNYTYKSLFFFRY